ncbi:MAG TPA: hypothetical protein PKM16_10455 [Bacteroidia bacterium]|nr:hypothetical protein [Bacteroidia bacterium]HNS13176.1 hypothetical protein [Bacteroidia bacterium]
MNFSRITVILILINFGECYSQSFKYRKYNYQWKTERPEKINVELIYSKADAVILEEKCVYNVSGNTVPAYYNYYSAGNYFFIDESAQGKSPIVQKYLRIKFLTREGIDKYSKFNLPESFDPQQDLLVVPHKNRDRIHRPMGEFECIRYFAARIIKKDGSVRPAHVDEVIKKETQPRNGLDNTFFSWTFIVKNLEPGDELELDYSYEGVYTYAPSSHIYFNGELPKQNYRLIFRQKQKDTFMVFDHNIPNPPDTNYTLGKNMNYKEYIFDAKNLKGGITDCGSRPANELPYITFYLHHMDFGISEKSSATIQYPLPYPWWLKLSSLLSYQYENLQVKLKWTDKTTTEMNKFVAEERIKNPDTSFASLISGIHHSICKDFEYEDDINYLEGSDTKLEKLGKHVENKTLRLISRHHFYGQIFLRLDRDYYLSVIADKRTDRINPERYESIGLTSIFYAVQHEDQFIFLYPKASRFGYEANEFPFYFEDVMAALVPQRLPAEMKTDMQPEVVYKFIRTPHSNKDENTRQTFALINASLDSLSINVNGKLKLSGQYSTLTRGFYLYGSIDTTIHPCYYNTIKDLADPGKTVSIVNEKLSKLFPFQAGFSYQFKKDNFIHKETPTEYSFDMDGWFNNFRDETFDAKSRQLSYYPDFKSEDSHRFMFEFNEAVELIDSGILSDTISNAYATYIQKVEQKDSNKILIETSLVVNCDYVPAYQADDVQSIFDAIKKMNTRKFKVKKV